MNSSEYLNKNDIFDDLFDNTFVGIIVVDKERKTKIVNTAFCDMFGYEEHEVLNQSVKLYHLNDDNFNEFKKIALNKVVKNGSVSIDYEFKRKDGSTFFGKISGNPSKNKNHILWTIIDITESIKTKQKLKEQTNLLETVINQYPNPIVLKNYAAKFVLVNKATADLYNSVPDEMIGKDDGDYIPDQKLADFFKKNVQEIMDKNETSIVYEDSMDVKTNKVKNYMSIKKPFTNSNGEKFILVLANDITEINEKNKELAKKEKLIFEQSKLASMGEMLGNIAHQWRQPLSLISTISTGIKLKNEVNTLDNDDLISSMDNITETTQYLSQTIEDFRSFYNPHNSKVSNFNIKSTISKSLNLLRTQLLNKDICITQQIDDFEIKTFENELIQVIINILNNAKDALLQSDTKKFIKITTYTVESNAYIEISDSANGIKEDIIDKVFEPYFTTKHQSQGTGIGLFMSEEIVKKHLKGNIYVKNDDMIIENNHYYGAKFIIELPLINN